MAWYRCGGTPSEVLSLPTPSEASGAIARFNTDLTENLLSAVAEFSASQAEGTPTPSTPIPIVGVDKVNVTRTNTNLLNEIEERTSNNVKFTQTDNGIRVETTGASSTAYCVAFEGKLPSGTYTLSGMTGASNSTYRIGRATYNETTETWSSWTYNSDTDMSFTLNEPTTVRIWVFVYTGAGALDKVLPYQLVVGSTIGAYQRPNGTTAIINLGGTYYCGSVDAVTGKITLTHKVAQITQVGDKNGTWDGEKGAFWYCSSAQAPFLNEWDNSAVNNGIKVDKFALQVNVTTSTTTNVMAVFTSKIIRWVDVDRMTMTKEDYNTYLASNPITILYPLATPLVVYASNTAEIPTLNGDNQVFADSGNIAVKFFETVGHKI